MIAVVADKPKGPSLNRTLNQSCRGADCLVVGVMFSDGVSRRCRGPARRACRDDPWRFTAGVVSPRVSLCASAAGWVQMRCRECATEVAVTARVCSGCGAPIVGQPPVVADAVVGHTVVGAVSDAAGKAVPAGVAEQALPEPYVPGSGDRVPVELRLVLAGYVGIAGGLFATALACAAAAVLVLFVLNDLGDDAIGLALTVCICLCIWGFGPALEALEAGKGFSRLLRRPSDPHTATVMASKRGERTLILDIPRAGTGRGYQPLYPRFASRCG